MPENEPGIPDPRNPDARIADQRGTEQPRATSAAAAGDRHLNGDAPDPDAPGGDKSRTDGPETGSTSRRALRDRAAHSTAFLWLKEIATIVVVAIVLSFLIKTFFFRAFYIPSESMVTTLDVNDRIFVNLMVPEPFALERGDVVVFKDTKEWLAAAAEAPRGPFTWVQNGLTFVGLLPDNSEQHLVKRVIGLPGDHVVCCDGGGRLSVNGTALEEKYINPAEIPEVREFDVVVPAGKVWVMGDNRNHSADSRAHLEVNGGFVDVADIEGKASVIAWPLNRISAVDNYPDVFRDVPAAAGK